MPKTNAPTQEQQRVEEWNTLYPEGTRVRVRLDDGSHLKTETLSEAWLLGGHTAVIKIIGIVGAFKLDRVSPL